MRGPWRWTQGCYDIPSAAFARPRRGGMCRVPRAFLSGLGLVGFDKVEHLCALQAARLG